MKRRKIAEMYTFWEKYTYIFLYCASARRVCNLLKLRRLGGKANFDSWNKKLFFGVLNCTHLLNIKGEPLTQRQSISWLIMVNDLFYQEASLPNWADLSRKVKKSLSHVWVFTYCTSIYCTYFKIIYSLKHSKCVHVPCTMK